MDINNRQTVDQLNSFLRGELTAVQTYRQALDKVDNHKEILRECELSHAERVAALSEEVRRRGGQPVQTSGLWGGLARAIEGTAIIMGEKVALAALEEGEYRGRDDYISELDDLDAPGRIFVERRLLPEQRRTHDTISRLRRHSS
jgi:demethoxyubiquinone hydroxylase (CLK1/Coq7/Cat5 family)